MQNECILYILPERRRQIRAYVAPDVDVFHSLARAPPHEVDDVKVFEVSSEVVSEDRCHESDSCMLLSSGWSEPAGISFAPDLSGNDPSSGRSRFLGH